MQSIDALYVFAQGAHGDRELLHSLRSLERAAPWVRKVWIFGDRPEWLADDTSVVEHVPHEYMARLSRWKLPLRNHFLMLFLGSLIPGLSEEFLALSDDFILLAPLTPEQLCRVRVLEDLAKVKNRGKGLFKDALWRTFDTLRRLGYGGLNFETHVPQFYTRQRVWEAFCDLQDYVSEDRYFGLLAHTAILNHAVRHEPLADLVWLHEEGRKAGFYGQPPAADEVRRQCEGKWFLNFDDKAWGPGIEEFLRERFPEPSKFERGPGSRADSRADDSTAADALPPASGLRLPTFASPAPVAGRLEARSRELLTAAFARAVSSRGQMSPPQYFRIVLELFSRGPCKLLVIGAGRDTELYVRANAGGQTAVLERHAAWIEQLRGLDCQVVPVTYTTRLADGPQDDCPLPQGLPEWLLHQTWDVILIDAPEGNRDDAPGRQQSILLASRLAGPGTTIFLHDYDRTAEQALASRYLKPLDERHGSTQALAVFRYPPG